MTSLLSSVLSPASTGRVRALPPRGIASSTAARAVPGGVVAALVPLAVCLLLALVGWFLSDAGAHGAPRDALGTGAVAWLLAHGSGVGVGGVTLTLLPLLLTGALAWTCWRTGRRLGRAVAGHGPDAARIAAGERDWTVPVAVAGFAAGYAGVVVLTAALAGAGAAGSSTLRALLGALVFCLGAAAPGVAVGSGRASVWLAVTPRAVRASAGTAARVLLAYTVVSALVLAGALVADLGQAATTVSRLGTDPAESVLFVALTLLLVPNAVAFTGSYLLGPGFAVGAHTMVSPGAVSLGPLPLVPLLAAMPAERGPASGWAIALWVLTPVLTAAVAAGLAERARPSGRVRDAALRGVVGGAVAGAGFAALAALAGGAAGPGRLQQVGVPVVEVLAHGVLALGLGALAGGVLVSWWCDRRGEASRQP